MATRRRAEAPADTAVEAVAAAPQPKTITMSTASGGHLGISLSNYDPVGVLVDTVHPADLCYRAGLRGGMVLVAVGGVAVTTHEDCLRELENAMPKGEVALSYFSAEDAAVEKENARLKYEAKWAWFDWKPKLLLVVVMLLLVVPAAYTAAQALSNPTTKTASASRGQDLSSHLSSETASPKPMPPMDATQRATQQKVLEGALTTFMKENKGQGMDHVLESIRERYLNNDDEDPRKGLEMLMMVAQEQRAFADALAGVGK